MSRVLLLLATLAQRFHLDTGPARPLPRPGIILQPAQPLHATLHAR